MHRNPRSSSGIERRLNNRVRRRCLPGSDNDLLSQSHALTEDRTVSFWTGPTIHGIIDFVMGRLPPTLLLLLIAALSAFAGAVVTWLLIYVTGKGQRAGGRSSSEEASAEHLLSVTRIKGRPAVFVRGRQRRHLREIRDRETGEEVIVAVKAVLEFAEGWLPALRDQKNRPHAAARPSVDHVPTPPLSMRPRGQAPPDQQSAASTSEPLQLVDEIDGLIQRRLQERPALARQGIRLSRDVNGRVLIYVGQHQYRSADEIPDKEVSSFIQDTIRMWENQ